MVIGFLNLVSVVAKEKSIKGQGIKSKKLFITNFKLHRNFLCNSHWFTLLHFVIDDPVDSAYCIPYRMENPAAAAAA